MPLLSKIVGAAVLLGSVIGSPTPDSTATGSNGGSNGGVSAFVQKEKPISLQGALANIGSTGSLDQGADSGVVIASPSKVNPNYVYTWTRDSALTLKMLVDEFIGGNRGLEKTIKDYIKSVAVIQTLNNPSGNLATGTGLGEPKFLINEKPFLGAWGRPQRDGPALRAIALMSYVEYLLATNQKQTAKNVVWPIIANDLAYVGQYWNQTGFDLWEEVHGSSFFTIQNQYKSMVQGSILSRLVGVKCDACDSQAPQLLCFLQSFWNGKYIVSNINTENYQRTGLDSNSMLGPIAAFDIFGSCEDGTFQPCNSKVLSTHKQLVDSFRGIYGINSGRNPGQAAAVGRYAEDVYYGGNPWYLCTLSAAEVLYDAIAQWKIQRQIKVDSTSQAFFKDIYPQIQTKTYRSNDKEFNAIIAATSNYADGFVGIVQKYTPSNGSLSEQYSRSTGQPLSAYDLTWSFASFVTMSERRSGYYPVTWGSQLKNSIPSRCQGTSVQGTYAPATAAGAPPISDECTNPITFAVNASTYYGENLYIEGNITDLGSWDPTNSYGMQASNYSSSRHLWYITIQLPASTPIDYNYFRVESDGSYIFEKTNRTIVVPPCGAGGFTTNDKWVGTCSTAPSCD